MVSNAKCNVCFKRRRKLIWCLTTVPLNIYVSKFNEHCIILFKGNNVKVDLCINSEILYSWKAFYISYCIAFVGRTCLGKLCCFETA